MSNVLQTIKESLYLSVGVSIVLIVLMIDSLLVKLSLLTPYHAKVGKDHD